MVVPGFLRQHSRTLSMLAFAALTAAAVTGAFLLRFEYGIPEAESEHLWKAICLAVVVRVLVYRVAGCDRAWRYATLPDVYLLFVANLIGSVIWCGLAFAMMGPSFPRSIYGIDFVLSFLATGGARLLVRSYFESASGGRRSNDRKNILIYGAGDAGFTLVKEIRSNAAAGHRVLGFLDDDEMKRGERLLGVPVVGDGRSAPLV